MRIAVIHGQKEVEHDDDETDGRNSPPPVIDEQDPEEPAVYTVPSGIRRKRNDSSKLMKMVCNFCLIFGPRESSELNGVVNSTDVSVDLCTHHKMWKSIWLLKSNNVIYCR